MKQLPKYLSPDSFKSLTSLNHLEALLTKHGAFDIATTSRTVLGQKITVVRAASTTMWPMGTHYWTRDNSLIADRLLNSKTHDIRITRKNRLLGMRLLRSNLAITSSPSQRSRMKDVIASSSDEFVNNAAHWPQIFLDIRNNLTGSKGEQWAHKQDAWQMLSFLVLERLENGTLSLSQLSTAEKEFLSLIVPFLMRVQYFKQQNSGSWEELEAVRSSVVAWELALLVKISSLLQWKRFDFLAAGFKRYSRPLLRFTQGSDISACLTRLIHQGALHLKRALPFESPLYQKSDPRYRRADSALIYLLQLNSTQMVANILNLSEAWVTKSEQALLKTIETLFDPRSGGHRRYSGDSYQRLGFFRHDVSARLTEMYGAPSGDVSKHFVARDKIVPNGPEAAWTHFTWQLSAWAGTRFCGTLDEEYFKMQNRFFSEGLRTITRKGMTSIEQMPNGKMREIPIPAYRFPECYLTEEDSNGQHYIFPTPHTPLNWATAEAISAFTAMRKSLVLRAN